MACPSGWAGGRLACSPVPGRAQRLQNVPALERTPHAGRGRPAGMPRATCRSRGFLGHFPGAVGPGLRLWAAEGRPLGPVPRPLPDLASVLHKGDTEGIYFPGQ